MPAPEIGAGVEQFGVLGSLEFPKAVFEVMAPVAGKVVAVSEELEASPEWVSENPFNARRYAPIPDDKVLGHGDHAQNSSQSIHNSDSGRIAQSLK